MEIGLYEDWMKPQIANLFKMQYGVNEKEFIHLIENFYEHPFQKNKCIRIVAKEGNNIIGFQTYFYWPYTFEGKTYNSYQSGKSLVHADHRGKGIFQKLLIYLESLVMEYKIDFLMGFPVEQSKNSFLRNKWENILDLEWYLKLVNPFGFFFSMKNFSEHFSSSPDVPDDSTPKNFFRLNTNKDFTEWRKAYSIMNKYAWFNYSEGGNKISFQLKPNKRSWWLHELVIGDIHCLVNDTDFIIRGFKKLKKKACKAGCVTAITFAVNVHAGSPINQAIKKLKFYDTKRSVYFIVKPFIDSIPVCKKENWMLYRSDIDTW